MSDTKTSEQLYMQLNASELSAIISKGSPNFSNDRDAGFCSGSSEGGDDLSVDHSRRFDPSSPTDASEDSAVEVKVNTSALMRNKRKSSEPSKVVCEREDTPLAHNANAPLKKRIRYTSTNDSATALTPPSMLHTSPTPTPTPFWDASHVLPHEMMPNPAAVFIRHPGVTTLHRVPLIRVTDEQEEPLALVLKKPQVKEETPSMHEESSCSTPAPEKIYTSKKLLQSMKSKFSSSSTPHLLSTAASSSITSLNTLPILDSPSTSSGISSDIHCADPALTASPGASRPQQRNYKNMTRERRIEANARERTRVHTISAAYETLRRAVPSYSHAQKLSKLSVLRVACSYILTLSRMAGHDYSEDQSAPSIASCFDAVTATIQTEGKIRKKKDE